MPDLPESDESRRLEHCQACLGYQFKDPRLLYEALTHASSASHRLKSNERMEFLGDAVLGLIVCEYLYRAYPAYSEGELTRIKSSVVSRRTCTKWAKQLELETCLIVGKGVTLGGSLPHSLAADVFEAVLAAIYLDGGLAGLRQWLQPLLDVEIKRVTQDQASANFKSALQQHAQREMGATPVYRVLGERGPDHSKSFRVSAVIGAQVYAPAWGRNKKEAEQRAAGNALSQIQNAPLPFPEPARAPDASEPGHWHDHPTTSG
jgi:ribonuclease-3